MNIITNYQSIIISIIINFSSLFHLFSSLLPTRSHFSIPELAIQYEKSLLKQVADCLALSLFHNMCGCHHDPDLIWFFCYSYYPLILRVFKYSNKQSEIRTKEMRVGGLKWIVRNSKFWGIFFKITTLIFKFSGWLTSWNYLPDTQRWMQLDWGCGTAG